MFGSPLNSLRRLILPVIVAASALVVAQTPKSTFTGKVVGVTDGDTIKVLRKDGSSLTPVKVRLDGVDAPESTQPFGTKSKQFASDMVFGKTVTVEVMDTDRYGRSVGRVHVGGASSPTLNEASVRAGMTWWYRQYSPKNATLQYAEAQARAEKIGVWSEPDAQAPWDYRHGKTKVAKVPVSSGREATRRTRRGPSATKAVVGTIVYVTETGSKYHAAGCRYLRRSSIPMKKSEAIKSYSPCSVCGGG